jgi:hypothetical protein
LFVTRCQIGRPVSVQPVSQILHLIDHQLGIIARPVGVHLGIFVDPHLQLVGHVQHISRHADLIGLGMAGLRPLYSALDVRDFPLLHPDSQNGIQPPPSGRMVPIGRPHPTIDVSGPIQAAGELVGYDVPLGTAPPYRR